MIPRQLLETRQLAVGAEYKGNVEDVGIIKPLLHAIANGVFIILGFDDGDRAVRFIVEDVVGPLDLLFVANRHVSTNLNWTGCEGDFLSIYTPAHVLLIVFKRLAITEGFNRFK